MQISTYMPKNILYDSPDGKVFDLPRSQGAKTDRKFSIHQYASLLARLKEKFPIWQVAHIKQGNFPVSQSAS